MILLEITIKVNLGLLIPCVRRWTHSQRDDNRRVLNCCILIVRIDSQIDFQAFLFVWNVCSLNRLFVRPTEQVLLLLPPFIILGYVEYLVLAYLFNISLSMRVAVG